MKKLYECDPSKNTDCPKKECQKTCFSTTSKKFAKDGAKPFCYRFDDAIGDYVKAGVQK